MKKSIFLTLLIIMVTAVLVLPGAILADGGFTIGPAAVNIELDENGNGETFVYVSSTFDGELVVGVEGIPVTVEPQKIKVTKTDVSKRLNLILHGDESFESKPYSGKLTFLAYSGTNVAYGVKIKANVTAAPVQPELPEEKEAGVFDNQMLMIVLIVLLLIIIVLLAFIMISRRRRA
ncbi:MAG: hypothetical protein P8105_04780 [Dehalococcoidia bacterium]